MLIRHMLHTNDPHMREIRFCNKRNMDPYPLLPKASMLQLHVRTSRLLMDMVALHQALQTIGVPTAPRLTMTMRTTLRVAIITSVKMLL